MLAIGSAVLAVAFVFGLSDAKLMKKIWPLL